MRVVLYETEQCVKALLPLTLSRPLFDMHIGGFTLLEAIPFIWKDVSVETITRDHLAYIYPSLTQNSSEPTLFLNASVVPSLRTLGEIRELNFNENFLLVNQDNIIIGSYVAEVNNADLIYASIGTYVQSSASKKTTITAIKTSALSDLAIFNKRLLGENILNYAHARIADIYQKTAGVFMEEEIPCENVIFNTTKGVIYIEKNVSIEPFTYLVGPLYIKSETQIRSHSRLENSFFGRNTRIGGEISSSVIESYTNKMHYGYVGDSYVGSWVNLGAGTTTSNIKNSYGAIIMNGVHTHEQFLGSVICDYVKTAINTSLYTGKVIGMNAHIYGTLTEDVPSFVNYVSKNNLIIYPLDVALKTAEKMRVRRNIPTTKEDAGVLSFAYAETEGKRKESGATEGKLLF